MTENWVLIALIAAWTVVRVTHLAFAHLRAHLAFAHLRAHLAFAHLRAQRAAELKAGRP